MKDGISPETWFFRYAESFEHLRRVAREHAERAARGEVQPREIRPAELCSARPYQSERPPVGAPRALTFNVASLGCASGAEAYSIAAALEGIVPARIIGIDRSAEELAIARSGRFRPMAIRGPAPAWAREPWQIEDGAVVVRSSLGASIEWIEHDLLDEKLPDRLPRFDVVFCRNVIIYLSEEARTHLGVAIAKMLRPGGWLYLGHAEPTSSIGLPWRGRDGAAFAFRAPSRERTPGDELEPGSDATAKDVAAPRRASARVSASPARMKRDARTPSPTPKKPRRDPARRSPTTAGHSVAPARSSAAAPPIEAIRDLADSGRRSEALALARARHAQGDRGADLLELLGTLELAEGHAGDAERHLRAALYLDPSRDDAALQLDLIRKRRTTKGRGETP